MERGEETENMETPQAKTSYDKDRLESKTKNEKRLDNVDNRMRLIIYGDKELHRQECKYTIHERIEK